MAGRRSWGTVRRLPSGRYQALLPNPDTHVVNRISELEDPLQAVNGPCRQFPDRD